MIMMNKRNSHYLSLEDRIKIKEMLDKDLFFYEIGPALGRHMETIRREVAANGGRREYDPLKAHQKMRERIQFNPHQSIKTFKEQLVNLQTQIDNLQMQIDIILEKDKQIR